MKPIETFLAALESRGFACRQNGNGWRAQCPGHDGEDLNLAITVGDDGRVLLSCKSGQCEPAAIAKAVGLSMQDLFSSNGTYQANGHAHARSSSGDSSPGYQTAEAVVQQLEHRYGRKNSRLWWYYNGAGDRVSAAVRFDLPDGKKVLPISLIDGSWHNKGMPAPRPLYNQAALAEADQVWIPEGEKCVDALMKLGIVGTTSPMGSSAAKFADWSPLAGKDVVISPDNDEPGEKYLQAVLAKLAELNPRPKVQIVRLDNLPDAGDVVDWIDQQPAGTDIAGDLQQIAEVAPEYEWKQTEPEGRVKITPVFFSQLAEENPELAEPVLDGLLRRGEIMNLISNPKRGKSWLTYGLAISKCVGLPWLDRFSTTAGNVLLIDNELHKSTLANRIPKVAEAMETRIEEINERLSVVPLRGCLQSYVELGPLIEDIADRFDLIIVDAHYRMLGPNPDENANGGTTTIYNLLDQYAAHSNAAWCLVHHTSKGEQGDKAVTDVGAGAGAQSRAADTHLILREHEQANTVVLEAAVRSFPPIDALSLTWSFPVWVPDATVDTSKIVGKLTKGERRQSMRDREGKEMIIKALMTEQPLTARKIREATALGKDRLDKLIIQLCVEGHLLKSETKIKGNITNEYSLSDCE